MKVDFNEWFRCGGNRKPPRDPTVGDRQSPGEDTRQSNRKKAAVGWWERAPAWWRSGARDAVVVCPCDRLERVAGVGVAGTDTGRDPIPQRPRPAPGPISRSRRRRAAVAV